MMRHKDVIKFAVDKVNKRVAVIGEPEATCKGKNDTKHAISFSKYAEEVGADAIYA